MIAYNAWDWQAVRERLIEAGETEKLLPRVKKPTATSGAWPSFIQEGGRGGRVLRRAMPDEISRMEEVLRWLADLPTHADRLLIHDFVRLKITSSARISVWCEKNGWEERKLNRRVRALCQGIADRLNRNLAVRLDPADCHLSEIEPEPTPRALPSKSVLHEMAPDARPTNLPTHSDRKALVNRMLRRAKERSRLERSESLDRP